MKIFASEKALKKQVMGIVTDSTPVEAPKEPDTIYKLYSYFAAEDEKAELLQRYRSGGMGYGDAKKLLLEKILETFKPFRAEREKLKNDLSYVKNILKNGAEKARLVAAETKAEVWDKTGLAI